MKTECAPVNSDQSEALKEHLRATARLVLNGRYRNITFDGSAEATTKTVKVRDPNDQLGPRNDVVVIDGAPKRTTEVTTGRWSRSTRRGQAAGQRGKTTGPRLKLATRRRAIACLGGHMRGHIGVWSMVSAGSTTSTIVVVSVPYSGAGLRNVRVVIATDGQRTRSRDRRPPTVISVKVQTDVQKGVNGCTTATYYRAGPRNVNVEIRNPHDEAKYRNGRLVIATVGQNTFVLLHRLRTVKVKIRSPDLAGTTYDRRSSQERVHLRRFMCTSRTVQRTTGGPKRINWRT